MSAKKSDQKDSIVSETQEIPLTGTSGNKVKKKKPLWKRLLGLFFVWIPLGLITFIVSTLIIINLLLTPSRVESLAKKYYPKSMNGSIDLKVEKFSLLSGFVINDITIKNPEPFTGDFVHIKKLVLDYSLPRILTGSVRFYEIGIYSPRVNLIQRNNVWNYSKLSKGVAKAEEPKKEEVKEPSEKKDVINLPINIDVFLKFILKDFQLYVDADSFSSHVNGLDFSTELSIPPVKSIPLGVKAIKLIDKFDIQLNPDEQIDVAFSSKEAEVSPPLILAWSLHIVKNGENRALESRLKAGTYNTPVRFKESHLGPLNFMISYDLFLDPVKDFLSLNSLNISFKGDKWISLSGRVDAMSSNQRIDISMNESRINLNGLYPYYTMITGDRSMSFGGVVSLFPLTVSGGMNDLKIDGNLGISDLRLSMRDFEFISGRTNVGFLVKKKDADMTIESEILVSPFLYRLDRSWSQQNELKIKCNADAYGNFSRVLINSFTVNLAGPGYKKSALSMALTGDINLKNNISGKVSITSFVFNRNETANLLSEPLSKTLYGSIPFNNDLIFSLETRFSLGDRTSAELSALFKVPELNVNDLTLNVSVVQDKRLAKITLNQLKIESKEYGIAVNAGGMVEMKRSPMSDSDLHLSIIADAPKKKKITGGLFLSGYAKISAKMKGDLEKGKASGSIFIKDLNFNDETSMTSIEGMNLDFPFEYDMKVKYEGKSVLAMDKSRLFENDHFNDKPNFSIKSIKSKHPARNEAFEYLSGFNASMKFKENMFNISSLKAKCMNGSIGSKEIFFYLADFNKKNMEYRLGIDITNIDVSTLDEASKKSGKALVSLNADIAGRGVDFKSDAWVINGNVNIFKIGDKFANRLMKGLSEEKGKSKLGFTQKVVDNFNLPSGFYFNLEESSVYTSVTLKRKFLGNVISIKDDKIQYDRIPIKQYLRKVGKTEAQL